MCCKLLKEHLMVQFSGCSGWIAVPDGSLVVSLLNRTCYFTTKDWFKYLHLVRLRLCSTVLLERELRYCFALTVVVALSSHTRICGISSLLLGLWVIWQPQQLLKEISLVVKAFSQWSWAENDLVSAASLLCRRNKMVSRVSSAQLSDSAQLKSTLQRGEEWVIPRVCTHFVCTERRRSHHYYSQQLKELIPINKEASYIHLFILPEHSKVMIWPPSNMAKSQLFQGLGGGLNS